MRIWKGLFYCFWMSDKPLIQEELAVNIASMIDSFCHTETSLLFYCYWMSDKPLIQEELAVN